MLRITVLTLISLVPILSSRAEPSESASRALLGLSSRAPTSSEARIFELPLNVRHCGQVIDQVAADGPAAKAGVKIGDVLLGLDKNDIYSFDDVADFLATSQPGRIVVARLKRAGTAELFTASITLGRRQLTDAERKAKGLHWQFAGLGQFDAALAEAKKQSQTLLVGLSGAET